MVLSHPVTLEGRPICFGKAGDGRTRGLVIQSRVASNGVRQVTPGSLGRLTIVALALARCRATRAHDPSYARMVDCVLAIEGGVTETTLKTCSGSDRLLFFQF